MKKQPKISVIGAGYVGLCTAVGSQAKATASSPQMWMLRKQPKSIRVYPHSMSMVSKKSSRTVYKKAI